MMELCEVYANAIQAVAKRNGLDTALRRATPFETKEVVVYAGGFFLTRPGITAPEMIVAFSFKGDSVTLGTRARNEQNSRTRALQEFSYAEGIDGWLSDLDKDLKAGKLSAPK